MNIAVIGCGYVGLVSGAGFAECGHRVTCVDKNTKIIESLNKGILSIHEPGLAELVEKNASSGRLHFSTSIKVGIENAQAIFVAVGTPMAADGCAELSDIFTVVKEIASHILCGQVLVVKSTVPVGTGKAVSKLLAETTAFKISVASNPEFLREGEAVGDFLRPDRIVIGVEDEEAKKIMEAVYRPFRTRDSKVIYMDVVSAELTKYAANGMLATRISFMNELANFADVIGANIDDIRRGIASDSRIGTSFLHAGVGYGGSCFPKDVRALIKTAELQKCKLSILEAVDEVNNTQRMVMLRKILARFGGSIKGTTIAVWGLAFKARTDDIRESPSIHLINLLLENGATIKAYDRAAGNAARVYFGNKIRVVEDEYAALDGVSALVVMTEWAEFKSPNWTEVKRRMIDGAVFDGRNLYDGNEIGQYGLSYFGVGKPSWPIRHKDLNLNIQFSDA